MTSSNGEVRLEYKALGGGARHANQHEGRSWNHAEPRRQPSGAHSLDLADPGPEFSV
ncbi:hypothetical protein ACFU98_03030 [Streptomyces sp. NPDC057575]|uniref:hypothetical protein n=1 Tax=unclassified Streptomyces TaxID=2593676 RepID=UPI0036B66129